MASSALEELPAKKKVFVDSTIFIYHFTGISKECRDFLIRCERGELSAVTSVVVLAEVAHRLLVAEAVKKGLVSGGNPAAKLAGRPQAVKGLSAYWEQVRQIPLMGIDIVVLDLKTLFDSAHYRHRYGLLVNDSLVAASAKAAGISSMATADADFRRVPDLAVYGPADIAGPP
jgi:predicted nucleic acid-binding protein